MERDVFETSCVDYGSPSTSSIGTDVRLMNEKMRELSLMDMKAESKRGDFPQDDNRSRNKSLSSL